MSRAWIGVALPGQTAALSVLSNPVRVPNRLKRHSLEQRKAYCKENGAVHAQKT